MDVILDAADRLRNRDDIRFLLVGDGVAKPALERRARESSLARVEFAPSVPPDRLAGIIGESDVCIATTRADPFCGETIPVKLFDYLACGRPVVAAVRGDAADLVEESGAGIVVEPEDGTMLARTLAGLADDPERRATLARSGPPFIEGRYSRRALGEKMVECVETARLAARGRAIRPAPAGAYAWIKRGADLAVSIGALVLLHPQLFASRRLVPPSSGSGASGAARASSPSSSSGPCRPERRTWRPTWWDRARRA
jgi:hypothetical protein